jgi:hypothetical protein
MTQDAFKVTLTSEQKDLFDKWLSELQNDLEVRLDSVKVLRQQFQNNPEETQQTSKSKSREDTNASWTTKTVEALKQLEGARTSAEIIAWLMEREADLQQRGKRYVTKNVTSKLSYLVDKGKLVKQIVDGKNFYNLKS